MSRQLLKALGSEVVPDHFSAHVCAILCMNHAANCFERCCSRNNISKEATIKRAVSLFDEIAIIFAKEKLLKLCNEKDIARKSCPSRPNVNVKHV